MVLLLSDCHSLLTRDCTVIRPPAKQFPNSLPAEVQLQANIHYYMVAVSTVLFVRPMQEAPVRLTN